jgi:hypothetical protein
MHMAEAEWSALEDVLHESLDGFVVLDRGVQLDGAPSLSGVRRADLAGVNRTGQLVLVHVLPRRDELLEAAVDLLSTLRERAGVLARHLSDARIDLAREPLAALVVDGAEPAGVAALRALRARELRLFERVRVQSGRATSAWIMPVDLQAGSAKAAISPLLEWIERIDSALGYFEDNCVLVCLAVNRMKSDLAPETFFEMCRDVVRWLGDDDGVPQVEWKR